MIKSAQKNLNISAILVSAVFILNSLCGVAFAYNNVSMRTWIASAPSTINFTAYYKGNDDFIQTEDSFDKNTPDSGYVYYVGPVLGYARVITDQISSVSFSDNYTIWAASSNKAGTASGPVTNSDPSYTVPGTSDGKLTLTEGNFLAVPGVFNATGGPGKITLTWNQVSGATEYRIYRRVLNSTNIVYERKAIINSGTTTTWDDSDVVLNNTYCYIMIATGSGIRSGHTEEKSAAPTALPPAGSLQFSSSTYSVGEAGSTASITVTRTGGSNGAVGVTYATSNGTATSGTDYSAATGQLSLADGVTSKTFDVTIASDTLDENNETVNLTLSAPTGGATLGTQSTAVLTINDDNNPPTVGFTSVSQTSASESGTMVITAQLSAVSGKEITVPFTVSGTATSGIDYTITSSPINIPAGSTTGTATITIQSDTLDEDDETVIVTMGTPTNATLGGTVVHTATITDKVTALDHVVINPANVILEQGASQTFTAKGYDKYSNETNDTFSFASEKLGNSGSVTANVAAGEYLLSAYKDGKSATATITVVSKYEEIIAKVEQGQVKLSAKDTLGNEVALAEGAVVAYEVTGKADGNQVKADGTFIPGTKEGDYTITAAVTVGGQTLTANTAVSVDLGGPVMQVKVDDQDVSNDLAISSKPKITVALTDGNGIKAVRIEIDGKEVNGLSVQALGSNGITSYSPAVALSSGAHTLLVEAEDSLGTKRTVTAQGLKVYDVLAVTGKPMNYPNPCQPSSGVGTTINYKLTQNTAIKLMIYDLTGRLVYSQSFAAGDNGGKLENDVTWDGRSFQGAYVPNGVYAYFITANGRALGSGEIAVYE